MVIILIQYDATRRGLRRLGGCGTIYKYIIYVSHCECHAAMHPLLITYVVMLFAVAGIARVA